jgi:hypothetical protein
MTQLKDKIQNALDESRTLVLGAEILIGFDFTATFQEGFQRISRISQAFNLLASDGEDTEGFYRVANIMILWPLPSSAGNLRRLFPRGLENDRRLQGRGNGPASYPSDSFGENFPRQRINAVLRRKRFQGLTSDENFLRFFLGNLCAFLARLGKPDRNCLLSAGDLAPFTPFA